ISKGHNKSTCKSETQPKPPTERKIAGRKRQPVVGETISRGGLGNKGGKDVKGGGTAAGRGERTRRGIRGGGRGVRGGGNNPAQNEEYVIHGKPDEPMDQTTNEDVAADMDQTTNEDVVAVDNGKGKAVDEATDVTA
nr:hypothetical protein [Tanacetum cinerariifolium]